LTLFWTIKPLPPQADPLIALSTPPFLAASCSHARLMKENMDTITATQLFRGTFILLRLLLHHFA
jgi:hypothetical protein